MKIASWNVNSIKMRTAHVQRFLQMSGVDVLVVQEIKCQNDGFPALEFADYQTIVHGQKSYNGVAVFSKHPVTLISNSVLEGDEQARYLEVDVQGVRIIDIYAPNGNPVDTEKFPYKLRWMEALIARADELLRAEVPFVILGDYNIIPQAQDASDISQWLGDALYQPESRDMYRRLINMGMTDALRMRNKDAGVYTFWDYQAGAWQRDNGIRIDHVLLSPQLADKCTDCVVDKAPRGWEQPSDHTPIIVSLAD